MLSRGMSPQCMLGSELRKACHWHIDVARGVQAVLVALPSHGNGFALHLVLLARLFRFMHVLRLMKVGTLPKSFSES